MTAHDPVPDIRLSPMERQVLDALGRAGPLPAHRIPTRWPLVRMHLPVVLDRLAAAGLVRWSDASPARAAEPAPSRPWR